MNHASRTAPQSSRRHPKSTPTLALAVAAAITSLGCVPIPFCGEPDAVERWPLSQAELQALLAQYQVDQGESDRQGEGSVPLPFASESILRGSLRLPEDYELFVLGPSHEGDAWTIGHASGIDELIVTVFEPGLNLLHRSYLSKQRPLQLTLRKSVESLFVGVQLYSNADDAEYTIRAERVCCRQAIQQRHQIVWLNFAGAADVMFNPRVPALSFEPFDGTMLGELYEYDTEEIKQTIIETLERTFGAYGVQIVSSDDAVRPDEPHSVIHFGGYDERYLGIAESVDAGNADRGDEATVYVENFDAFWDYEPPPLVLGTIIGNVAAHELGHLLGLHHASSVPSMRSSSPP